jgi:hypothetical protein
MWVVVLVVVAGGAWYMWGRPKMPQVQPQQQQAVTPPPAAPQAPVVPPAGAQIKSNTSLDADVNSIDTQSQDAASAGASAQSTTDTPVAQTE